VRKSGSNSLVFNIAMLGLGPVTYLSFFDPDPNRPWKKAWESVSVNDWWAARLIV
jgi:hypothetical protein